MSSKSVKFVSTIFVVIAILASATYYIKYRIRMSDLNEKLSVTIGKDEGLIEIILKIPGSEITYGEVFDLCDKSVNDRIQLIIDLRGLYPEMKSDLKDTLIDFLSIENELVRDVKQSSRREMNIESKRKELLRLQNSEYSEYYYSTIRSEIKEVKEDLISLLSSSLSFKDKYEELLEKENRLSVQMAKAGLRFIPLYAKYKTANIEMANNQIANCQKYLGN